jgi:hypothetical protein
MLYNVYDANSHYNMEAIMKKLLSLCAIFLVINTVNLFSMHFYGPESSLSREQQIQFDREQDEKRIQEENERRRQLDEDLFRQRQARKGQGRQIEEAPPTGVARKLNF